LSCFARNDDERNPPAKEAHPCEGVSFLMLSALNDNPEVSVSLGFFQEVREGFTIPCIGSQVDLAILNIRSLDL